MAHPDGQDGGMAILDGVWRHPAIQAHRQACRRPVKRAVASCSDLNKLSRAASVRENGIPELINTIQNRYSDVLRTKFLPLALS